MRKGIYPPAGRLEIISASAALNILAMCLSVTAGAQDPAWIRILTDADEAMARPELKFIMAYIEYDDNDDRLSASCWYRYTSGLDPIVLQGKKLRDGRFQPLVEYQVATEDQDKWKTLQANIDSSVDDNVIISAENPVAKLLIDMSPFRKAIGVFKFGRLILSTGVSTVFEIEDLLPTSADRGHDENYKEVVFKTPEDKRREGFPDRWIDAPVELFSVTSIGTRLVGTFIYISPDSGMLIGNKTGDGDFWPDTKFEIANAGGQWKTIGKAQRGAKTERTRVVAGESKKLKVLLNKFKPYVNEFRFGKIVLSNGHSGIFALKTLTPDN